MSLAALSVLVEAFRKGSFFLWISIGAASSGILALLDVSTAAQIAVFINISGILVLLERRFSEQYTFKKHSGPLKLIGDIPRVGVDNRVSVVENGLNVFRRSGNFWEIRYQGISCTVKHSIGLVHIRNLIIKNGKWIHCSELKIISSRRSGDSQHQAHKTVIEDQIKIENLRFENNIPPERLVDQLSWEKIKKLRHVLIERRESNEFDSPEERIDQLNTLDFIEKYLKRITDNKGRPRKILDQKDTDRKAVSIAITRSRNNLSEHEDLFVHLKSFIQAEGNSFRYLPDRPINWKTD